jgi:hypothetical protein
MHWEKDYALFTSAIALALLLLPLLSVYGLLRALRSNPRERHLSEPLAKFIVYAVLHLGYFLPLGLTALYGLFWEPNTVWMGLAANIALLGSAYVFFGSRILQQGFRNRRKYFAAPDAPAKAFALYLRDSSGEHRTVPVGSPDIGERQAPHQRGAETIANILEKRLPLIGLWSPTDSRSGAHFEPILSTDAAWREDIEHLAQRAVLICADFEHLSPGVQWEVGFLVDDASLLAKTLVIFSPDDESLSNDHLRALLLRARWRLRLPNREQTRPARETFTLPAEFEALISQKA